MTTREDYLFAAKLAETAERYDEMQEAMRGVVLAGPKLNAEERSLFSSAYKHVSHPPCICDPPLWPTFVFANRWRRHVGRRRA